MSKVLESNFNLVQVLMLKSEFQDFEEELALLATWIGQALI